MLSMRLPYDALTGVRASPYIPPLKRWGFTGRVASIENVTEGGVVASKGMLLSQLQ